MIDTPVVEDKAERGIGTHDSLLGSLKTGDKAQILKSVGCKISLHRNGV